MVGKRSRKDGKDTEEIINLLRTGNEHNQKTLELIDNTFSASTPDLKRSWCLWMEASVKEIHPSLWRLFQDHLYQLITQFIDQSAAV